MMSSGFSYFCWLAACSGGSHVADSSLDGKVELLRLAEVACSGIAMCVSSLRSLPLFMVSVDLYSSGALYSSEGRSGSLQ